MNEEHLKRLYKLGFVRVTGLEFSVTKEFLKHEISGIACKDGPRGNQAIWARDENYVILIDQEEFYLADSEVVWFQDSICQIFERLLGEIFNGENLYGKIYSAHSYLPKHKNLLDTQPLLIRSIGPGWEPEAVVAEA
jgi:hypothetical protein